MCGIVGILHRGRIGDAPARVHRMAESIRHRGPDDDGFFHDHHIALGFRRLAIVDLETGDQPMPNEDQTVWVVFNGEIYNHVTLRRDLEARGHRFRSDHSDTEVIVHGFEEWGEGLCERLNGMFAFAAWNQKEKTLLIARDRLGIKPVYLAETSDGSLLFASEIRALHASGLVPVQPDDAAVVAYVHNQNVWHDRTMFRGIRQLTAGRMLIDDGRRREKEFWDISFDRRETDPKRAAERLRDAVEDAIDRQVAADVPVMAYLSGGIDSSALVAGAHRRDPGIRAYSCLFKLDGVGEDKIVDEREFSRLVAADLEIRHIEMEVPPTALAEALVPTIAALEEPRMGMAYVNYLIAGRVAQDSKVVLSGCGGDEMLGGYLYRYAAAMDAPPAAAPRRAWWKRLLKPDLQKRSIPALDRILPLYTYPMQPGERAFTGDFRAAAGDYDLRAELGALLDRAPSEKVWDKLMYADAKTYLAGLLMVEDKLSMAHSLEARVPLLDNEVVDLALSFDWGLMNDGLTGKKVFRDAIRDWVPNTIADKPKMGFGPPDASWYRGALQPFIRLVLSPERVKARGVFNPAFVAETVDQHMLGAANKLTWIWSWLSFEAWCEAFGVYGGDLGQPIAALSTRTHISQPVTV